MDKTIKRGDIYYADLNPVVGSEQGGTRPVLVISNDIGNKHSPTVIIAAITSRVRKKKKLPTHLYLGQIEGLPANSIILFEQLRTIDKSRLKEHLTHLDEKLLKLKEQQEEYKRVCGRCYNKKYLEYICVDEMGTLISPHYLTASFPKLLEKNNLRHIRFHDLRHSCASLLLANGVPMKQIQEWLGHSDFSTTANVYAHLDYNSKLSSADAMVNGLSGALEVIS